MDSHLHIVEGDADALKEMVRKHKLDLAFIRDWDGEVSKDGGDEFRRVPFAEDRLVAVLPSSHPLASKGKIRLGELANEEFLLLPEGTLMHALILDACAVEGFVPQVRYQGRWANNIIDLVARGMGVSLLMRKPVVYLAQSGVSIVDVEPTISTQIDVYYLRDEEPSKAVYRFLSYMPVYAQVGG